MPGKVSVVIAVRNGASFLAEAIDSVHAQTHPDIELIVVDDASSDDSSGVARSRGVDRLVALESHEGVSTARNVGTAVATGEFITFLDADDILLPSKVERQMTFLRDNPDCGCVLTDEEIRVLPGAPLPDWLAGLDRTGACDRSFGLPISFLTRTRDLYRSGGYNPTFVTSEEMDVLFRLQRGGILVDQIREPLVIRRIHGANASYQTALILQNVALALSDLIQPSRSSHRVSVVIPAYNNGRYLVEAVASVRAQRVDAEVIIVEDGSTDDTPVIAAALAAEGTDIQLIRQPNLGIGAARNHGVLLSRGSVIAFLDGDDVWLPDKLRTHLGLLDDDPSADVAHGWFEEFAQPGQVGTVMAPRPPSPGPITSDLVVRRSAFCNVGPFSVDPARPEWVDWWMRALEANLTTTVSPRIGMRRRLHDANRSRALDLAGYVAVVRDSLHRRLEPVASAEDALTAERGTQTRTGK